MPTSDGYWNYIHREVQAGLRCPRCYDHYNGMMCNCGFPWIASSTPPPRPICPKCGYDRPDHIKECRACQLFKDHAGTVGDAKRFHTTSFFRGYRAWRRFMQQRDRLMVENFLKGGWWND